MKIRIPGYFKLSIEDFDPQLLPLLELLKTTSENNLLFQFSKEGNLKFVKYLIENGADINAKDNEGNTALTKAVNEEIKKLLIKNSVKNDK